MPNWTQNTIRVAGEPALIRGLLDAVAGPEGPFDFNRLIPMPGILRHTASGARDFDGETHKSWYVENPDAPWDERIERAFTADEDALLRDIGYRDWYSWSLAHWGTKWNACHTEVTEPFTVDEGYIEIRFDTAWCMPSPVAEALFELFPQLEISWTWSDEHDGYTRRYSMEQDPVAQDDEEAA